uniref:Palmitoyltransferase n=1 Tax=Palpitomonas bilix TaxID=652834 RepID=A0A7S3D977_9EUKA|mmetsp:Transcript_27016/g.69491  ORF Transcript_27016/g.69491 Transcript_27016/m.69491 type:complete len:667 (+) Transcript_27016:73-2073(+)
MDLLDLKRRLKPDSYLYPEEGLARLDFEDGSFYRGGWTGNVGFTPIKPEAAGILEFFDLEGYKDGAGHQHYPDGSEYCGFYSKGLPDGYGVLTRNYPHHAPNKAKSEVLEGFFKKGKVTGPAYHCAIYDAGTRTTFGWFRDGKLSYSSIWIAALLLIVRAYAAISMKKGKQMGVRAVEKTKEAASAKQKSKKREEKVEGGSEQSGDEKKHESKRQHMLMPSPLQLGLGIAIPLISFSFFYLQGEVFSSIFFGILYMAAMAGSVAYVAHREGMNLENAERFKNSQFMQGFFLTSCICAVLVHNLYSVHYLSFWQWIWFDIFSVIMFVIYAITNNKDPGYLPQMRDGLTTQIVDEVGSKFEICETCGILRVHRSKHCKHCDRCVQDLDHHCPGLHCCIGAKNHLWFVLFSYVLSIGHALFFLAAMQAIRGRYSEEEWEPMSHWTVSSMWIWFTSNFFLIASSAYNNASLAMQAGLAYYHTIGVLTNITTNESVNWKKYSYMQKEKQSIKKRSDVDGTAEKMGASSIGMSSPSGSEGGLRRRGGGSVFGGSEKVVTVTMSAGSGDGQRSVYTASGELREFEGTTLRVVEEKERKSGSSTTGNKEFFNSNDKGYMKNIAYAWTPPNPRVESILEVYNKMKLGSGELVAEEAIESPVSPAFKEGSVGDVTV